MNLLRTRENRDSYKLGDMRKAFNLRTTQATGLWPTIPIHPLVCDWIMLSKNRAERHKRVVKAFKLLVQKIPLYSHPNLDLTKILLHLET